MKVVALDVDGVLNRFDNRGRIISPLQDGGVMPFVVEPEKVGLFNKWALTSGVFVVVSSTWRIALPARRDGTQIDTEFLAPSPSWSLFCHITGIDEMLAYNTDDWRTGNRFGGDQRVYDIDEWHKRNPEVKAIVGLDDMDILKFRHADDVYLGQTLHVQTDPAIGLLPEHLVKLDEAFKQALAKLAPDTK